MVKLEPKQQAIILLLVAVIIFGGGYRLAQVKSRAVENRPALNPAVEAGAGSKSKEIAVHVSGAVSRPGLYRFTQGARVADALEKAGPAEDADINAINLAAILADGQKVTVPFKATANQAPGADGAGPGGAQKNAGVFRPAGASPPATGGSLPPGAPAGAVNINTAGPGELDTLPGIGPTLAERIIQHREVNGPFKQIEDIKNVTGIGDKKFEDIKDRITVW